MFGGLLLVKRFGYFGGSKAHEVVHLRDTARFDWVFPLSWMKFRVLGVSQNGSITPIVWHLMQRVMLEETVSCLMGISLSLSLSIACDIYLKIHKNCKAYIYIYTISHTDCSMMMCVSGIECYHYPKWRSYLYRISWQSGGGAADLLLTITYIYI